MTTIETMDEAHQQATLKHTEHDLQTFMYKHFVEYFDKAFSEGVNLLNFRKGMHTPLSGKKVGGEDTYTKKLKDATFRKRAENLIAKNARPLMNRLLLDKTVRIYILERFEQLWKSHVENHENDIMNKFANEMQVDHSDKLILHTLKDFIHTEFLKGFKNDIKGHLKLNWSNSPATKAKDSAKKTAEQLINKLDKKVKKQLKKSRN